MLKFEFIGCIIMVFIIIQCIIYNKREKNFNLCIIRIFCGMYILLLVNILFFPLPIQKNLLMELRVYYSKESYQTILIPFQYIHSIISSDGSRGMMRVVLKNVVLFIPFTIYVEMLFPKFKGFKRIFLLLLIVSIGIETVRYTIILAINLNYKDVSIDEVIMFLTGGIIGYVIHQFGARSYQYISLKLKN